MQVPEYVASDGNTDINTTYYTLASNSHEIACIKNDLLQKLSAESKFVLYVIFNTPGELSKKLFRGKRSFKTSLIRRYLKCIGWDYSDITKTLTELKQFTKELTE